MKRFLQITGLVLAVAVVAVLPFLVRGGLRYYALQKVLRIPEARTRVALMPSERTIAAPPSTAPVDLGYATFDMGQRGPVFRQGTGPGGTCVWVTNRTCEIVFMPPFSKGTARSSRPAVTRPGTGNRYPRLAARLEKMQTDPISSEIDIERTTVLPLVTMALMSKDEFNEYAFCLGQKACLTIGGDGVYFFTNGYTKGMVRLGAGRDARRDRKYASAMFAALHGDLRVGCHVSVPASASNDLVQVLDPILGSFRFTMSAPAQPDAVRERILGAGIPLEPEPRSDGAASSEPLRSATNRTSSAADSRH